MRVPTSTYLWLEVLEAVHEPLERATLLLSSEPRFGDRGLLDDRDRAEYYAELGHQVIVELHAIAEVANRQRFDG